jgi:hypothetical protein
VGPFITRFPTLPEPADITQELWQATNELLEWYIADFLPHRVRALGRGLEG